MDVDDQVGLGQLVAPARHLGFQVAHLAVLSGGCVDLRATRAIEDLGRLSGLTLLAPSGQMGRIDGFLTQQGADIARSLRDVGSGKNAELFRNGKGAPLGDRNDLWIGTDYWSGWIAGFDRSAI